MNFLNRNVNDNLQNKQNSQNNIRSSCSDSAMDRAALMKKIQELSFAKTETELYLDAHPYATPALEYYKDIVSRLQTVTEEYEAKYGPIVASSNAGESWEWTAKKWPWQYDSEEDV